MQAKQRYSEGAYASAENYKNSAKKIAWIGIVVGLVANSIFLSIAVVVVILRIDQLQRA